MIDLCRGKFNNESRALSGTLGFGPYLALVRFNYLLRDEKSVTGGVDVDLHRIFAVPALGKEQLHILRRNADAAVFHREAQLVPVGQRDFNIPRRRVSDSIIDEISQHVLTDFLLVAVQYEVALCVYRRFDADVFLLGCRLQVLHRIHDGGPQVE